MATAATKPSRSRPADKPASRRLPCNVDAEESILGAMLLSGGAADTALETLRADHFFVPAHGEVFDAIAAMTIAGQAVDCLTVADTLRRRGTLDAAGGPERLLQLEASTPTLTHVDRYVDIVVDAAQLRRLIAAAAEIANHAYRFPPDVAEAVDQAEAAMYAVAHDEHGTETASVLSDLAAETLDRLEAIYENDQPAGLRLGFADLDRILGGIAPAAFTVVGARPSMGKTSWALAAARHIASAGEPVLFFSLEMTRQEVTDRVIAGDARVDLSRLRSGDLRAEDWSSLTRSLGRFNEQPLWIDDTAAPSVAAIRGKSRRIKARLGGRLGLIVVDYLQLLNPARTGESRQVDVAEMSRGLKVLARELQTPVLALSQLSRALEQRADKRPMLSDLRESGAIEQDADIVMFIHREEVYDADTPDVGIGEIIVAKHRNGPTGTARLAFLPRYALFADMH